MQTEQRGLAASRGTRDRDDATSWDDQVERMQDDERAVAARHVFGNPPQLDHDVEI